MVSKWTLAKIWPILLAQNYWTWYILIIHFFPKLIYSSATDYTQVKKPQGTFYHWASPVCTTLRKTGVWRQGCKGILLSQVNVCKFLFNLSAIFHPHTVSFRGGFGLGQKCPAQQKASARDWRAFRFIMLLKEQRHLLLFQTLDSGSGAAAALRGIQGILQESGWDAHKQHVMGFYLHNTERELQCPGKLSAVDPYHLGGWKTELKKCLLLWSRIIK